MNVFVLPSWYPSANNPASGVFVREQVMAVARACPDTNLTVGTWGHLDAALSLRDPVASVHALRWRARHSGTSWRTMAANVAQVTTPALTWTLALAGGNVAAVLRASRKNLAQAEGHVGPPQLIHAHVGFPAGWVAARLARERRVPFVVTEHMSPFPFPAIARSACAMRCLRQAYAEARAVIAVSPSLAQEMQAHDMRCTHVVPNVVDMSRFTLSDPPTEGPFTFFSLGGPSAQKGTDVLVRALAQPVLRDASLRVVIGGSADARGYRQLAQELDVASRIEWLGGVAPDQVPQRFAACHALVQPSRHESFGVVLIEALTCGRPVIATRCGGPESIVNESNGLLVDVEDPVALAHAMRWMIEHASRYQAEVLRTHAERRFSGAGVACALVDIYDAALAS